MARDLRHELDTAVDDTRATTWNPEIGDSVIGIVRAVSRVALRRYERPQLCVAIEDADSGLPVNVYCSYAVLAQRIVDQRPEPGDRIAIKRGIDEPGKGYRRYWVIVDRTELVAIG